MLTNQSKASEYHSEGLYPSSSHGYEGLRSIASDDFFNDYANAYQLSSEQSNLAEVCENPSNGIPNGGAINGTNLNGFGLAWDGRRGRWISLVYRYSFPRNPFFHSSLRNSIRDGSSGRFSFGPCKSYNVILGQNPLALKHISKTSQRRHRQHHRLSHISEDDESQAAQDDINEVVAQKDMPFDIFSAPSSSSSAAKVAAAKPVALGQSTTTLAVDKNTSSIRLQGNPLEWDDSLLSDFLSSAIMNEDFRGTAHPLPFFQDSGKTSKRHTNPMQSSTLSRVVTLDSCSGVGMPPPSSPPPPLFLDGPYPIPDILSESGDWAMPPAL